MKSVIVFAVTAAAVLGMTAGPVAARTTSTPTLESISPIAGRPAGGNILTIGGRHLGQVTAVRFGSARTTKITHVSSRSISVVVPKHARGSVRVALIAHGAVQPQHRTYRYTKPPRDVRWGRDRKVDPETGDLINVSCPSADFCAARDDGFENSRLLTFGSHSGTAAQPAGGRAGPSCGLATYCLAANRGTVRRWDGKVWRGAHTIMTGAANIEQLSCAPSTRFCLALNDNGRSAVRKGGRWRAVPTPKPIRFGSQVSCASSTFCLAVANRAGYEFDGSAWTKIPHLSRYVYPAALSCTSATFCMLVGDQGDDYEYDGTRWVHRGFTGYHPVALSCASSSLCVELFLERMSSEWDGSDWSQPHHVGPWRLNGVSCVPDGGCTAVDGKGGTLTYDGTVWSDRRVVTEAAGDMTDASCVTASWCVAVDAAGNAIRETAGRWHGVQRIDDYRALRAVSCGSSRRCVAIDSAGNIVELRRGDWHAPQPVDAGQVLVGIACVRSTCTAVDRDGGAVRSVGAGWRHSTTHGKALHEVSCPTRNMCVAVGVHSSMLRNGRWRQIPNPASEPQLDDVTCLHVTYCVAGGAHGFYVWNHGTWSAPIVRGNLLNAWVACTSERRCLGTQDNGAVGLPVRRGRQRLFHERRLRLDHDRMPAACDLHLRRPRHGDHRTLNIAIRRPPPREG